MPSSSRGTVTPREPPIPNSYWLPDRKLIAGEYPGHPNHFTGRPKFFALLDAGVRSFIDLTEEHELEPYDAELQAEALARGIEVSHVRISIRDMRAPGKGVMRQILEAIDTAQAEDKLAYVHCWGGVGRTGTVVGCHLIEKGNSCEDALTTVQSLFAQTYKSRVEGRHPDGSPETGAQRDYVRGWKKTIAEPETIEDAAKA